jgi:hypothetical protein
VRRPARAFAISVAPIAALAVVATSFTSPTIAYARSNAPRIYHPTFKRIPGTELLSGSNYVAIYGAASTPDQVQLINKVSGHTMTTSQPGCVPDAIGGSWLAMTCESGHTMAYALYDIPVNRTLPFTPSPALTSTTCGIGCQSIAGIGAHWIALTAPCADTSKCPTSLNFENLITGATRSDPTNRTTRIDLDTPRLSRPVCRPLAVPQDNQSIEDGTYPGWGSLTLDGSYGIEAGGSGVVLQRCGSRTRTLLTRTASSNTCAARACPPPSNQSMVVWQSAAGRLGGVFLKRIQRFQITVPPSVDPSARQLQFVRADPYTLALTTKMLYLGTPSGTVWAAPMPPAPR